MIFFFQAEDGIRDLVRSRGLGDVYKRQGENEPEGDFLVNAQGEDVVAGIRQTQPLQELKDICLLYTSDAADERSSVDLGGRRIIKKKKSKHRRWWQEFARLSTKA